MTSSRPDNPARPRVLIADPLFHPKGGGAAVAFWAMEALRKDFRLTVLAWGDIALEEGNRLHGTAVRRKDFELRTPPRHYRWLGEALTWIDPSPWSVQRWAMLMRYANAIAPEYDAVLSTNGEFSLQCRAMQYIHYPYIGEANQRKADGSFWDKRPWEVISRLDWQQVKDNYTLANSNWTGKRFEEIFGSSAHTLYPPVPGNYPEVPWEDRDEGFVCVGRFNGDKRLDLVIDTVAAVRERFPAMHLHLVGMAMPEEPGGSEYVEHLRKRAAGYSDWLFLEENLSRQEMVELLSRHRYGIHAKKDEHFGIAVAELVSAGCLTFTHRSGGQVEIVADERLLFDDQEEAVRRILTVVESPVETVELREHLRCQAALFSSQRFMDELVAHLRRFLAA